MNEAVDIVYLWVDGNDPEFRAQRNKVLGLTEDTADSNCEGRIAENDELMFSLRSVAKYAPWIRNIYIVTDNQTPRWLNISHPRIKIINQNDIIPKESVPTFNSVVIEHQLHNIPELSEHFLYSNDDMFFNRPVEKSDFFTSEGDPIMRLSRRPLGKFSLWFKTYIQKKALSTYNKTIVRAARLVEKKTGRFIPHKPHHNIDAFRKSQYAHTFDAFREDILPTLNHHLRSDNDIQRVIYSYYPIAEKRVKLKFVSRKTSFRVHIDNHSHYHKLRKSKPMFFCLNDSQFANDDDRKLMREFLMERFPDKSEFEL